MLARTGSFLLATAAVAALAFPLPGGAGVATGSRYGAPAVRTAGGPTQISSNWAGYAVTGVDPASAAPVSYRAVSGSWVQAKAACTPGAPTYSSFWVGLGGFSEASTGLEQIGTEADCTASGAARYSVWYELIPAPAVELKLKVAPGDVLSAVVAVTGPNVTLRIRNLTRHSVFTKRVTVASPDLSSAEWVAEAPSTCDNHGRCRVLPLANFGTVAFSQAAAATPDGHSGTVSDAAWTTTPIELVTDASSGAVPGELSPDGSAFSVNWQQSLQR